MVGSRECSGPEALPWLQAEASVCGEPASGVGEPGITAPAVQASCSPLGACSGFNPTWPPAWQGPLLSQVTEQHESLPELATAPPRTTVAAGHSPGFLFNSLFSELSCAPDRSSSLVSAYWLKRTWLFAKYPGDNHIQVATLGSEWRGEGVVWGRGDGRHKEEVWLLLGGTKEHSQSFRCTEMR